MSVSATPPVLEFDWLGASRAAAAALREILAAAPTSAERVEETGTRGEGGDLTLVIDADAEAAVFDQLDRLHAEGARFTAISEERGIVDYGTDGQPPLVVIDPIDGSMNAKRGLPHAAISIAVADGPTMGDVVFAYVYDLGPGEEWYAVRGEGAHLDGHRLGPAPAERRKPDGRLELVAVESSRPEYLAASSDALLEHVHRVRAIGSMAISLCQLTTTRVDGMVALWRTRAVDAAAAQLIAREGGALVSFSLEPGADPLDAPLDLDSRLPLIAARTPEALARLATLPSRDDA
jgi:myo-inositol-1(or 4)-monophosphatase